MAPPFRFALLTDIQLADKDNTHFEGRTRHHRQVPSKLHAAINEFLRTHAGAAAAAPSPDQPPAGAAAAPAPGGGRPEGLVALLQLGDVIDGYPGDPRDAELSRRDLGLVLAEFGRLEAAGPRVFHTFGNHDLAVPRDELARALGLPEGSSGYYDAALAEGWRLVVLDTTDISLYGRGEDAPETAEARRVFAELKAAGTPHAMEWNSGVGAAQLAWLRRALAGAAAAGERVIVAAHHPLVEGSAPAHYLAWNHAEIRAALEERPGLVPLVLTGHFHAGGAVEANGVHYVTYEGLVEAPPGSNSYAVVEVGDAKISIRGGGYGASRELKIAAPAACAQAPEP